MELYKKYRPKKLDDLIGQEEVVSYLKEKLEKKDLPHTLMFCGGSGGGKTSTARILKKELNCSDHDYYEINAAESRGIDAIRDIQSKLELAPWEGDCRIWLYDECHALTKNAQEAMLVMLEDTPRHCYFFLATTSPESLIKTIHTRSTVLKFNPLTHDQLWDLLVKVTGLEEEKVSEEVLERIIELADGSARQALVDLDRVIGLGSQEERLAGLDSPAGRKQAIDIARSLMNPKARWSEVVVVLKDMQEDPEKVRRLILAYTTNCMLKDSPPPRALLVYNAFRDPFTYTGRPGLIAACFEVFSRK